MVTPSLAASAPPLAVGAVPPAFRPGQMLRHAPEQLLLLVLSASNRYSVRPLASTRYVPSGPFFVLTADPAPPADVAADAEPEPPPLDPPLLAMTTTTATAATSARGMMMYRFIASTPTSGRGTLVRGVLRSVVDSGRASDAPNCRAASKRSRRPSRSTATARTARRPGP